MKFLLLAAAAGACLLGEASGVSISLVGFALLVDVLEQS